MSCLFCNIVAKTVPASFVFENEHAVAFRDTRPVAPTHVLVIPRAHVDGIRALTEADASAVGQVLVAAQRVARELGLESAGYRLVVNDGDAAGQSVQHLHVHVLGGRTLTWPPG